MAWHYETSVKWLSGERGLAETAGKQSFEFTPPPEFGGVENVWNPELLLVSSIETCMLLTSLHFIKKFGVEMKSYSSKADGELAKTPQGLRFQKMTITVSGIVAKPEDVEKFKSAVANAEKWCPVSNAVNFPVHVVAEATTG